MRKIQVLLAVMAFVAASAGVYASEVMFSTVYYEDTGAPGTCNETIILPCTEGMDEACKTVSGNNVWKRENGGACEQVFREL